MSWTLLGEILIAILAVFGLYCILRLIADALFRSENILYAVEVNTEEELQRLNLTIEEARGGLFAPRRRVAVLLNADFACRAGLLEALERRDVDCYVFEMEE